MRPPCRAAWPNLASGGQVTETGVEEFLDRTASSPENLALRELLQKSRWCQPVTGCHAEVAFANANKSPADPPQIGVNRTSLVLEDVKQCQENDDRQRHSEQPENDGHFSLL